MKNKPVYMANGKPLSVSRSDGLLVEISGFTSSGKPHTMILEKHAFDHMVIQKKITFYNNQ